MKIGPHLVVVASKRNVTIGINSAVVSGQVTDEILEIVLGLLNQDVLGRPAEAGRGFGPWDIKSSCQNSGGEESCACPKNYL